MTTNLTNLTNGADWPRRAQLRVRAVREVRGPIIRILRSLASAEKGLGPRLRGEERRGWTDD